MRGPQCVICVVKFDLQAGQQVHYCIPSESLTKAEQKSVAYHSFPDSKSLHDHWSIRDTLFHFRVKRDGKHRGKSRLAAAEATLHNAQIPSTNIHASASVNAPGWLYAYSFCRQRQDSSLPRGGDQTSVVVLLDKPYMPLLQQICKIAGQLYFDNGEEALLQVLNSVRKWNTLKANTKLSINFSGQSLAVQVPERNNEESEILSISENLELLDQDYLDSYIWITFTKSCIFSSLHGVLRYLWHLWEVTLLGQPVMIYGDNPEVITSSVAAVMDLIYPLPYCADFRPYFTVHDAEFQAVQNPNKCQKAGNPSLIGVTNTYFLKSYRSWPNILAVGGGQSSVDTDGNSSHGQNGKWKISSLFWKSDKNSLINVVDGKTQDLWTKHIAVTKVNYSILKALDHVDTSMSQCEWDRVAAKNTKVLRKHFRSLTSCFLDVFNVYFKPKSRSGPDCGYAVCLLSPAEFKAFNDREFVLNLQSTEFPRSLLEVAEKPKLIQLYELFLKSPNFKQWFDHKMFIAKYNTHREWSKQRITLDIRPLLEKIDEYEAIDSFGIIEKQLLEELRSINANADLVQKLRSDLETIYKSLPKELQQSMLLNPQQAQLIKDCYIDGESYNRRLTAPEESLSFTSSSPLNWFKRQYTSQKSPERDEDLNDSFSHRTSSLF